MVDGDNAGLVVENVRGGRPVTSLLHGQKQPGTAQPITDEDVMVERARRFVARQGAQSLRPLGMILDDDR